MRSRAVSAGGIAVSAAVLVATLGGAAWAGPDVGTAPLAAAAGKQAVKGADELPNPLESKRRELREAGLTAVINGEATPERIAGSTVVKVGEKAGSAQTKSTADKKGPGIGSSPSAAKDGAKSKASRTAKANGNGKVDQYVKLSNEGTDRIFVILAEFGNKRDPRFPDKDIDPSTKGPIKWDGPLHNEIPKPGPNDNTTIWQKDYSAKHYRDLYFSKTQESLKTYYEKQSSGRYSVGGEVTDWVKVDYNEARYGRSSDPNEGKAGDDPNVCGSSVCSNTWQLVRDALNQWVADQKAKGLTTAEITADLKTFDKQDRYDYDGDGNFNEPDGYLDHFQIVHAGGDEADGDEIQGEDAIWSHRWYAFGTDQGRTGPAQNPLGGTQIGDTGIWAGDYTMQPENGGLSVFAHEYGHDLGLPDSYDTNGGGAGNSQEFWNLMAQSRLNGRGEPIGNRPGDMGAWEKLQLGWLDYETVLANQKRTIDLGPHEYNSRKPQAVVTVLPKKEITNNLGAPYAGTKQYWSGSGDDLSNTMTRQLDLSAASTASLSMKSRFEIESEYDYLYVQASTDNGASWTALDGTADGKPFIRDASGTPAISGSSGGKWLDVTVPMNDYTGQKPLVRFLYRTDGGFAPQGFFADDITLTVDGEVVLVDGAEEPTDWTLDGFTVVGATATDRFSNYYIASNRSYVSYDRYLKTGPYNFGFLPNTDRVEHFPYQPGLLISYWDTSQRDNNTTVHPGQGLNLNIDAHPRPIYNLDGQAWRSRIQIYDATFSRHPADSFTLHIQGRPSYVRGQAAQPVFKDTDKYFYDELPTVGVKLPAAGVKIKVVRQNGTSMRIRMS